VELWGCIVVKKTPGSTSVLATDNPDFRFFVVFLSSSARDAGKTMNHEMGKALLLPSQSTLHKRLPISTNTMKIPYTAYQKPAY
jgi:hypothetical protein